MTDVIAVRRFWWVDEPQQQLLVSIGKPEEAPSGAGEFYCPVQTSGFGNDDFVQPIYGIDGFQAIELALRFIGHRVADINAKNRGRLRWQFGENGHIPEEWALKQE